MLDLFRSAVFIGGEWIKTPEPLRVLDKFTGAELGSVGLADRALADRAVANAAETFRSKALTQYQRYEILMKAEELLNEKRRAIIDVMVAETGFTINDCTNDFNRTLQTLRISAEEAKRISGELVPIQGAPGQDPRRLAFTLRMPVGVVCAITPFNSPLNTVCHKVAPALAAGNTVVLKPSSNTPLSGSILCRILTEAGLPAGFLNVVNGDGEVGTYLLENQAVRYYTFTGSTRVGKIIQQAAGLRRTQLELGNISATIICDDANLELAATRCVAAGFRKAGQVCTSVQRILVHEAVIDDFAAALADKARALKVGDPRDPETFVGPMISEKEARRAESWIREAVDAGAQIVLGGERAGPLLQPTILRNVSVKARVLCDEIFAPVVSLVPFSSMDQAVEIANGTAYGLAVGVFTNDLTRSLDLVRKLEMGTIHVNDTSSSRVDLMPYGGVKDSGFGQEGPKYAIRDMTEERLITLNPA